MAKQSKAPPQQLNAAIYARYSSAAQNDASIEQQIAECQQYAGANRLTVVATYEDRAKSGRSDKRPGFQRMIRAAERGEFQVILTYKSNRIARNMYDALRYEVRLNAAGVKIVYCKEDFGDNAAGRLALRMMMSLNEFYSDNMAEDIRRGLHDGAIHGRVVGALPYGYKKSADGKYAVDEFASKIVQEIFNRYLSDESMADVMRDLNDRGIRTRHGKPWNKNSFQSILTNEKYTGSYDYAGTRIEDAVPIIIDKGVFAMVQEKMKVRKLVRKRRSGHEDYILTGKLFCGYCLAPMVGMSAKGNGGEYYYYACQTRRSKHTCNKEHVRKDEIEAEVVKAVQQTILDDDTVEWIADTVMEMSKRFKAESQLVQYESQYRDVKRQIGNIIRAIEMGVAGEEVKERMDELQAEKHDLEGRIAIEKIAVRDYDRAEVIGYIESIRHGDSSDKEFQKAVIRDFVKAVYLYDDHFKIVVDFTGRNNSIDVPLKHTESSSHESSEGFAQGLIRSTTTVSGEPLKRRGSLEYTEQGFVLIWHFEKK